MVVVHTKAPKKAAASSPLEEAENDPDQLNLTICSGSPTPKVNQYELVNVIPYQSAL
jgi:hypothetical protein